MQGPAERETPADGRGRSYEATPLDEHAVEVLSHELRSPITTIHLGAKVLRSIDVRTPVRDAVLEAVDLEADRLLRVVEDLLAVVRHETGQRLRLEPLLVQRRLGDLLGETRTEPGPRVRSFLPQDLPAVMADDAALGQVVRNLVINANHHGASPSPTEIVGRAEPPDWVSLEVLDRGQGIDPVDAERIFEPFYRSPATSCSGAGLGLAAAQRLMTAMGGSLDVAPRPGGGTVFTIRLRVARPGD
jgi:signal transduction histidine kinase